MTTFFQEITFEEVTLLIALGLYVVYLLVE